MTTWVQKVHDNIVKVVSRRKNIDRVKFGIPFEEVCVGNEIPNSLVLCFIKLIEDGAYKREIFRAPGSCGNVKALLQSLHQGKRMDLSQTSTHAIASVLKLFLQKLPGGFFGIENEKILFGLADDLTHHPLESCDQIKDLISGLSLPRQHFLSLFLGTLKWISIVRGHIHYRQNYLIKANTTTIAPQIGDNTNLSNNYHDVGLLSSTQKGADTNVLSNTFDSPEIMGSTADNTIEMMLENLVVTEKNKNQPMVTTMFEHTTGMSTALEQDIDKLVSSSQESEKTASELTKLLAEAESLTPILKKKSLLNTKEASLKECIFICAQSLGVSVGPSLLGPHLSSSAKTVPVMTDLNRFKAASDLLTFLIDRFGTRYLFPQSEYEFLAQTLEKIDWDARAPQGEEYLGSAPTTTNSELGGRNAPRVTIEFFESPLIHSSSKSTHKRKFLAFVPVTPKGPKLGTTHFLCPPTEFLASETRQQSINETEKSGFPSTLGAKSKKKAVKMEDDKIRQKTTKSLFNDATIKGHEKDDEYEDEPPDWEFLYDIKWPSISLNFSSEGNLSFANNNSLLQKSQNIIGKDVTSINDSTLKTKENVDIKQNNGDSHLRLLEKSGPSFNDNNNNSNHMIEHGSYKNGFSNDNQFINTRHSKQDTTVLYPYKDNHDKVYDLKSLQQHKPQFYYKSTVCDKERTQALYYLSQTAVSSATTRTLMNSLLDMNNQNVKNNNIYNNFTPNTPMIKQNKKEVDHIEPTTQIPLLFNPNQSSIIDFNDNNDKNGIEMQKSNFNTLPSICIARKNTPNTVTCCTTGLLSSLATHIGKIYGTPSQSYTVAITNKLSQSPTDIPLKVSPLITSEQLLGQSNYPNSEYEHKNMSILYDSDSMVQDVVKRSQILCSTQQPNTAEMHFEPDLINIPSSTFDSSILPHSQNISSTAFNDDTPCSISTKKSLIGEKSAKIASEKTNFFTSISPSAILTNNKSLGSPFSKLSALYRSYRDPARYPKNLKNIPVPLQKNSHGPPQAKNGLTGNGSVNGFKQILADTRSKLKRVSFRHSSYMGSGGTNKDNGGTNLRSQNRRSLGNYMGTNNIFRSLRLPSKSRDFAALNNKSIELQPSNLQAETVQISQPITDNMVSGQETFDYNVPNKTTIESHHHVDYNNDINTMGLLSSSTTKLKWFQTMKARSDWFLGSSCESLLGLNDFTERSNRDISGRYFETCPSPKMRPPQHDEFMNLLLDDNKITHHPGMGDRRMVQSSQVLTPTDYSRLLRRQPKPILEKYMNTTMDPSFYNEPKNGDSNTYPWIKLSPKNSTQSNIPNSAAKNYYRGSLTDQISSGTSPKNKDSLVTKRNKYGNYYHSYSSRDRNNRPYLEQSEYYQTYRRIKQKLEERKAIKQQQPDTSQDKTFLQGPNSAVLFDDTTITDSPDLITKENSSILNYTLPVTDCCSKNLYVTTNNETISTTTVDNLTSNNIYKTPDMVRKTHLLTPSDQSANTLKTMYKKQHNQQPQDTSFLSCSPSPASFSSLSRGSTPSPSCSITSNGSTSLSWQQPKTSISRRYNKMLHTETLNNTKTPPLLTNIFRGSPIPSTVITEESNTECLNSDSENVIVQSSTITFNTDPCASQHGKILNPKNLMNESRTSPALTNHRSETSYQQAKTMSRYSSFNIPSRKTPHVMYDNNSITSDSLDILNALDDNNFYNDIKNDDTIPGEKSSKISGINANPKKPCMDLSNTNIFFSNKVNTGKGRKKWSNNNDKTSQLMRGGSFKETPNYNNKIPNKVNGTNARIKNNGKLFRRKSELSTPSNTILVSGQNLLQKGHCFITTNMDENVSLGNRKVDNKGDIIEKEHLLTICNTSKTSIPRVIIKRASFNRKNRDNGTGITQRRKRSSLSFKSKMNEVVKHGILECGLKVRRAKSLPNLPLAKNNGKNVKNSKHSIPSESLSSYYSNAQSDKNLSNKNDINATPPMHGLQVLLAPKFIVDSTHHSLKAASSSEGYFTGSTSTNQTMAMRLSNELMLGDSKIIPENNPTQYNLPPTVSKNQPQMNTKGVKGTTNSKNTSLKRRPSKRQTS